MVKEITTKDEFQAEVLDSGKTVIVDFWAEWCGPCKMLKPTFEKVSNDYGDVIFIKINVDEGQEIAQEQGIRSIPTLKIFKGGSEVAESMGALNEAQLKEFIDNNK